METLNVLSMLSNGLRSISNTFYNAAQDNLTVFMQNKQYDDTLSNCENVMSPRDEEMEEQSDNEYIFEDKKGEVDMDMMTTEKLNENDEQKMECDIEMGADDIIDEKVKVSENNSNEEEDVDEKETGDAVDDSHDESSEDEDSDDFQNGDCIEAEVQNGTADDELVTSNDDKSNNFDLTNGGNAEIFVGQKLEDNFRSDENTGIVDHHHTKLPSTLEKQGSELQCNPTVSVIKIEDNIHPVNVDESQSSESQENQEIDEALFVMERSQSECVDKIASITENFKKKLQKLQEEAVKKTLSELNSKPSTEKNKSPDTDIEHSEIIQNESLKEELETDTEIDSNSLNEMQSIEDNHVESEAESSADVVKCIEITDLNKVTEAKCIEITDIQQSSDKDKSETVDDVNQTDQEKGEVPVKEESEIDNEVKPSDQEKEEMDVKEDSQIEDDMNQVEQEKGEEPVEGTEMDGDMNQAEQEKEEEVIEETQMDDVNHVDQEKDEVPLKEELQMGDGVNLVDQEKEESVKEMEMKNCVNQDTLGNMNVDSPVKNDEENETEIPETSVPVIQTIDLSKCEFNFGKIEPCVTVDRLDVLNALYDNQIDKASLSYPVNNDDDASEFEVGGKNIKKMETSGSKFTCQECGRNFRRNNHLVTHRKIHAKKEEETADQIISKPYAQSEFVGTSFLCEICGRTFKKKGFLDRHIRLKH